MTQLLASDWSIPEVSVSSSEVSSSEAARPKVWTSLDTFIQWLPLGGSQRNSNDRSQELKLSIDNYCSFFVIKSVYNYQKTLHAVYYVNYETVFERLMMLRVTQPVLYLASVNRERKGAWTNHRRVFRSRGLSPPITARARLRVPSVATVTGAAPSLPVSPDPRGDAT